MLMGGSGGGGVRTPLFGPRCRLFNIGPPPGLPLFLLVDIRWTPLLKNPGSAPVADGLLIEESPVINEKGPPNNFLTDRCLKNSQKI